MDGPIQQESDQFHTVSKGYEKNLFSNEIPQKPMKKQHLK
jgi:hypothetical protein